MTIFKYFLKFLYTELEYGKPSSRSVFLHDKEMQRILGIDPGSRHCGWAIIKAEHGQATPVAHGLIKTVGGQGQSLHTIYQAFQDVFSTYAPHEAALESIFFNRNVSSAVKVGEARGVAILAAHQAGIEVGSYTPQQIKKTISGSGNADKKLVQEHVQTLLGMSKIIKDDHIADAYAVAWCHAKQLGIS